MEDNEMKQVNPEENPEEKPEEISEEISEEITEEKSEEKPEEIIEEKPAPKKPPLKKRVLKEIREWVVSLAVALLIVFVLRSFVFTMIRVDGQSMYPTLHDGQRLFTTVYDVKFADVDRNDIIICNYPGRYTDHILGIKTKTLFVKRAVAVPGDTISRKNNVTYVTYSDTGETIALDEPYANRYPGDDYEYTLKDDEYFAVGDNRANSHDSRNWKDSFDADDVGPITKDMLVGHVRFIIWPIPEISGVE